MSKLVLHPLALRVLVAARPANSPLSRLLLPPLVLRSQFLIPGTALYINLFICYILVFFFVVFLILIWLFSGDYDGKDGGDGMMVWMVAAVVVVVVDGVSEGLLRGPDSFGYYHADVEQLLIALSLSFSLLFISIFGS